MASIFIKERTNSLFATIMPVSTMKTYGINHNYTLLYIFDLHVPLVPCVNEPLHIKLLCFVFMHCFIVCNRVQFLLCTSFSPDCYQCTGSIISPACSCSSHCFAQNSYVWHIYIVVSIVWICIQSAQTTLASGCKLKSNCANLLLMWNLSNALKCNVKKPLSHKIVDEVERYVRMFPEYV